ncbi:MAG: phage tail sheath subtilisin-like domain-containing protein [Chloroflexi bacterium]|nr:phage tail sheath subtilisin-like domain-containing protein [Chloroflexota bacterium]
MATAYYSPGVYIEEVDKGPKPIQGVSTSITAFVGITAKAELLNEDGFTTRSLLSEAKLITNWTQYENCFGSYHEKAFLPYSVRGFFDNGGQTCWVISIHALEAHPAQTLLYAKHPKDEKKEGEPSLLIYAKEAGPIGKKLKVGVTRDVDFVTKLISADSKKPDTKTEQAVQTGKKDDKDNKGENKTESIPPTTESKQPDTPTNSAIKEEPSSPAGATDWKRVQLAEDEFIVLVEMDGKRAQPQVVKLDDLPLWTTQSSKNTGNHKIIKTGKQQADGTDEKIELEHIKMWRVTKNGRLAERMPKPVTAVELNGGAPKFDVELFKEDSDDYKLLDTTLTAEIDEADFLKRNAPQLFNGSATKRKGADGLEAIDNLNLVCAPDLVGLHKEKVIDDQQLISLQKSLLTFCQRTNYRFAILDAPHDRKLPENILDWKQKEANFDSMYGALYYPWLKITDPLTGKTKEIPPSGHIAGVYARSDTQRGVHKAPANELVLGPITDVTLNVTKGEQDLLNPVGINCIRAFPGRGIRIWGARTLSSDPAWRYINVRRLFNYVEESVERSTQWVVFEPNDYFLWGRVRRDITAFLRTVWTSGALFGASPDQAFYVKCDEELNPPEIRDQGIMICEVGLAPVKPAEFVVFRFSQYAIEAA